MKKLSLAFVGSIIASLLLMGCGDKSAESPTQADAEKAAAGMQGDAEKAAAEAEKKAKEMAEKAEAEANKAMKELNK